MRVECWRQAPEPLLDALRMVLVAVLAGLAAACATLPKPEAANQDKLAALFAETYRKIEEVHLDGIRIEDLERGGLSNLLAADQHLSVPLLNSDDILLRDGKMVHQFGSAGPRDYDAWGAVTSTDVIATVEQSDVLQAMEPQRIYDLFMAGVTGRLGEGAYFFSEADWDTYFGAAWYRSFDIGYDVVEQGVRIARLDQKGELEGKGLKLGDVITQVNGQPTAGLSKVEVFRLLSGFYGEEVTLTLRRDTAQAPVTLKLFRQSLNPLGMKVHEDAGIAEYGFFDVDYNSTMGLLNGVGRTSSRAQTEGILLDLRNTPDHLDLPTFADPDAVARLANVFLGEGILLDARSRHQNLAKEWKANGRAYAEGLPVVILMDSTTSGGAEMAAAALGDAGRALLIGGNTAGDGKLTTLSPMPTGGHLVTPSSLAYAPAGYPIEDRGVTPHICAVVPGQTLDGLLAVLHRGEGVIPDELRTRATAPSDKLSLPAAQRQLCPELPALGGLAYALAQAILRQPGLYDRLMQQGAGS